MVRIQGGILVLLVVAVVLEPLTAESLVHRLGRLGMGPLCWPRVSYWVLVDAAVEAHSYSGPERLGKREGRGLKAPVLFLCPLGSRERQLPETTGEAPGTPGP